MDNNRAGSTHSSRSRVLVRFYLSMESFCWRRGLGILYLSFCSERGGLGKRRRPFCFPWVFIGPTSPFSPSYYFALFLSSTRPSSFCRLTTHSPSHFTLPNTMVATRSAHATTTQTSATTTPPPPEVQKIKGRRRAPVCPQGCLNAHSGSPARHKNCPRSPNKRNLNDLSAESQGMLPCIFV